ncbi:MAG: response regulator [Herpetosiphonaceae bacterium]|nr:response regulator [Herpetosiphonaceae bacterium]
MSESDGKIHVLIADDIAETRDILEKALYFEKDIVVVAKAANGREAVQLARQHRPEVVLMDINMPEMDGIAATEAIMVQVPGTQVIIMSVQNEQEYLRRAMLAGAREYLIKPPDTDELVRSIRHVAKLSAPRATIPVAGGSESKHAEIGKLIAVFSPKGGVGCTAISVNLAVALRQLTSKKVAIVDGNMVFGDVDVAMDTRANKNILDLTNRANDIDEQLIGDVMVPHASQVRVLLGPPDGQSGEAITPEQLRIVLEALRKQFDYVVIDTATAYDDRTLSILDLADRILVLMTLELTTIKNVRQFLELAVPLGYGDEKLMLVLNKADSRLGIKAESVESQMRRRFAAQIGNAAHDMTLALNQGVPLVMDRRNHQVAKDILNLAAVMVNSLTPVVKSAHAKPAVAAQPAASRGLFGRLTAKH